MKRIIPCVFITLALILAGSFFPVFGFIGLMICPLPLCVLGCTDGHKIASVAELAVEVILFLAFSMTIAVYFFIGCAPLAAIMLMLSESEFKRKRNYSGAESLLVMIGASIFLKLVLVVLFWFFTKRNILMPDMSQVNAVMTQLYGAQPELKAAMVRALAVIPYLMSSMLIIYCSAECFMVYSLCHALTKKLSPKCETYPPELPEFKLWRFPASLILVSVLSLLLGYFIDTEEWFDVSVFIMNLQITLNVLMFIEGLSILFWILDGFRVRRGFKVLACGVVLMPFFWPWLIVMGMCDIVLNLRERIKVGK